MRAMYKMNLDCFDNILKVYAITSELRVIVKVEDNIFIF